MNKTRLTRSLITVGLVALVGTVGAQTYYAHELAQRVASQQPAPPPASAQASDVEQWGDAWAEMHADLMRMRERLDAALGNAVWDLHPMPGIGIRPSGGRFTLQERGDDYVVTANLPGAKESDIKVNLDGRLLSISSQIQGGDRETSESGKVLSQEHYASSFQEAFTLPGPVSAAGMHSQYQDGVLTVTIPKSTS